MAKLTEEEIQEVVQEVLEEGLHRKGVPASNVRINVMETGDDGSFLVEAHFDISGKE